jgi:hypothetical protein
MEDNLILTAEPCCDMIPTCDVKVDNKCQYKEPVAPDFVEEKGYTEFVKLAAVLQDSILYSWQLHLKTKKYYAHLILQEYYEEAFDIIDGLIEHYQGICKCDIIDGNVTPDIEKSDCPVTYFTNLKNYLMKFVNEPNNFSERTMEIKSDIDDLLRLIDSTLYKLGNLSESIIKSFDAFVYENLR